MKHGRPEKYWYETSYAGLGMRVCRSSDALGWRREHAARVWQAMQAVVAVVAIVENADSIFSEYWDEWCKLNGPIP